MLLLTGHAGSTTALWDFTDIDLETTDGVNVTTEETTNGSGGNGTETPKTVATPPNAAGSSLTLGHVMMFLTLISILFF